MRMMYCLSQGDPFVVVVSAATTADLPLPLYVLFHSPYKLHKTSMDSLFHSVRGDGRSRVGEVRAGATSPHARA